MWVTVDRSDRECGFGNIDGCGNISGCGRGAHIRIVLFPTMHLYNPVACYWGSGVVINLRRSIMLDVTLCNSMLRLVAIADCGITCGAYCIER